MLNPGQIGSPFSEGKDHSGKLLVLDQIIDLGGCKLPRVEDDKTTPMPKSEASFSTWKGLVGSGWTNTGAMRKVALRASKSTLCCGGSKKWTIFSSKYY